MPVCIYHLIFHVFSDVSVSGCICHVVSRFNDPSQFCKIDLLDRLVSFTHHEVYLWVHADSFFARPLPRSFLAAICKHATFGFLCEDLTDASVGGNEWYGLSRSDLLTIASNYHLDSLRYTIMAVWRPAIH
jgi:hypothetical protein